MGHQSADPPKQTIVIGTCFRPLSKAAKAEADERGMAKWRDTDHRQSEGVAHAHGDNVWFIWNYLHIRPNLFPPGCTSSFVFEIGRPTWDAYTSLVAKATTIGARYLMVIEDDVFIPPQTVHMLYSKLEANPEYGAVGGLYAWRRQPDHGEFFQIFRDNRPLLDFPLDQWVDVDAAGLGCMMFRMEALHEAKQLGRLFDDPFDAGGGVPGHGGDLCVQKRVRDAGYKIAVHTGIKCWHRDFYTGVFYPNDPEMRAKYGFPAVPLPDFCEPTREEALEQFSAIVGKGETQAEREPVRNAPTASERPPGGIALNVGWGGVPARPDILNQYPVWHTQDMVQIQDTDTTYVGDCRDIPADTGTYDLVYANHVLEHLDLEAGKTALQEWWRLVKPGGRLWLALPEAIQVCEQARRTGLHTPIYYLGDQSPVTPHMMIYGQHSDGPMAHKALYEERDLRALIREVCGVPDNQIFSQPDADVPCGVKVIVAKSSG